MYVGEWARARPDHPAVVIHESGITRTYGQVESASNRLAHHLRRSGLGRESHYSVLAENHPRYLEVCVAGERSGLYFTPVNSHLTAGEVGYILSDSRSRVVVTTPALVQTALAAAADAPLLDQVLVMGEPDGDLPDGTEWLDRAIADCPDTPLPDESLGAGMFYSSGTTGHPKGIVRPLPDQKVTDPHPYEIMMRRFYGSDEDTVYLSPAPMYHTAPLGFSLGHLHVGATVVVLERFDAAEALRAIQDHRVSFAQFVPTMFVRMLKLPEAVRSGFDLSSLEVVVHAAAPCPLEVKEQMIEWLGPIVHEYYGGSENNGYTYITAAEWLSHKGSVGRSILGELKILDDDGSELPPGEIGTVYFADGADFAYHGDPDKTAATKAPSGINATTLGDVGYLDEEGYLYLTDRKAYMIISGGVNIYPQEVEDALVVHPKVADVAVFGVPDAEMGEQVKAVVQPVVGADAGPELEAELIAYCRERLAGYKCPRSVDFEVELPRLDTGKLYKRLLKDRYWPDAAGKAAS